MIKTPEEIIAEHRESFKQFMTLHKLNANNWSKMAGIAEATIRHYLSGRNHSMTSLNLELLAQAGGAKLSDVIACGDSAQDLDGFDQYMTHDSLTAQRNLFVQAYEDFEAFQTVNLNKSARERAEAIFTWYQLSKQCQQTGKAMPKPEEFQHALAKK